MSATTTSARRWAAQVRLDALMPARHRFLHVMLGMALLFGLLVRFALPDELARQTSFYVVAPAGAALPGLTTVPDRAALDEALHDDDDALGLVLDGERAELVLRGSEPPEVAALARRQAEVLALSASGARLTPAHEVTRLSAPRPPLPFSTSMVPVLLAVDVVLLGFLFASVCVLQEKTWGTVRFFRVGPGTTALYLGSKLVVMLALTALGTLVLVAVAVPSALRSPLLWLVVLLGGGGLTLFGIGLAAWFRSLKTFFIPLVLVSLVAALPLGAYFVPTFSLGALSLLPTWAVMTGAREALAPSGPSGASLEVVRASLAVLVPFLVGSAAFATLSLRRRVLQGS